MREHVALELCDVSTTDAAGRLVLVPVPDSCVPAERGASAAEYALLVAGIAAVLVVVLLLLGGKVQGLSTESCGAVNAAVSDAGSCG